MKSNSKKLIRIIKIGLDVTWYGNFVLAAIAFGLLSHDFLTKPFVNSSSEVTIRKHVISVPVSVTNETKGALLTTVDAHLSYKTKVNSKLVAASIFFFLAIEGFILLTIYHLRKVFKSLNQHQPFSPQVVKSLKVVSLVIALISPFDIMMDMYSAVQIGYHFADQHFSKSVDWNFEPIITGAILYIMAEIFNHGLELKKENEEFV